MECLVIFFLVIVVFSTLFGVGTSGAFRSGRLKSVYQQLAQHYGGIMDRAGWLLPPGVRFWHHGSQVNVRINPHPPVRYYRGQVTQFTISWPDSALRCVIQTPPMPAQVTQTRDYRELLTGVPDFDRRYSIRGTDHEAVRAVLSDAVQIQVDKLRRLLADDRVYIEFGRGELNVIKWRSFGHIAPLLAFVEGCLELYEQAMVSHSRGIDFVEDVEAQLLDEVVCSVCGDEIEEGLVYCRRCKTPHHRECWQYNGLCSVFGCGETRFDVPQTAQRISAPKPESEEASEEASG